MKLRRPQLNNISLQKKLVSIYAAALLLIIGVNAVMFFNVNTMMSSLEQIYISNLNLDQLLTSLNEVQDSMTNYLYTKSSDSLEEYYRAEQSFGNSLRMLNTRPSDDILLIAEKNIYQLSADYLKVVDEAINAKRGRDVAKYSDYYEQSEAKHDNVAAFIYSLNNDRFRQNSRDYNVLLTTLKYQEIVIVFVLAAAGILTLLIMAAVTGSIILPLQNLSEAARQVSEGNFDVALTPSEDEDEIGILSRTFSQMLTSIRNYVAQLRESLQKENAMKEKELMMESRMKDAQLKYLQAQINPHFLFNTLNAGAQLAMLERADRTAMFIDNMASFFRYNINKLSEDATLGEELKLVDNYLYILNVRFSGEIHYMNQVDEQWYQVRVPSMILQPIVENAVNYGIRDLDREKIIEISDEVCPDGSLIISVWDNGKGMTQERIREVLARESRPEGESSSSNGIGIHNVMERMELYFGTAGLVNLKSEGQDKGTEVTIRIPGGCSDGQDEQSIQSVEGADDVSDHAGGR